MLIAAGGRGSFIDSVVDALNNVYGDVIQHLKAWTAAPPKMRESDPTPAEVSPALVSTALSSQDGAEPVADPGAVSPSPQEGEQADVRADGEAQPEPVLSKEPASF